jgi:hypothetical protein
MLEARCVILAVSLATGCTNSIIYREEPPTIAYPIMNSSNEFRGGGVIGHTINELRQLDDQNQQSIVPNDADKVYNQRFIQDLERKREKACRD